MYFTFGKNTLVVFVIHYLARVLQVLLFLEMYLIQATLLLAVLSFSNGQEKKSMEERCEKWTEKFELCLAIGEWGHFIISSLLFF